ncbi:hypothetical protein HYW46_01080 [Candidatus Daviesbacteria bacterium]|nr:hypothetical protein [Candidatus Daviesbacteria bacterium]
MQEMLDGQDIRRGIDFSARMGKTVAENLEEKFSWWGGSGWSSATLVFLALVFFINLLVVYPIFTYNLAGSFSSSALLTLAFLSEQLGILKIGQFLQFITISSLILTPVSIYFFVRKNTNHDLTALFATLFFILPNPFVKEGMPLLGVLFSGDGAHVVAFTFIPLILLLVQAFISEGISIYGVIGAMLTAGVAIISPFSAFTLLCLFGLLILAEGFLGHIRIKIARLGFLLTAVFALTAFWYFPNVLNNKIIALDHVGLTLRRITGSLPVAIPAIPIFGTVSFLIFDRRAKLKPVFLSASLLLYFYLLYSVSNNLNINGIFTAERYVAGLTLGAAFFLAVMAAPLVEMITRKYILKLHKLFLVGLAVTVFFIGLFLANSGYIQIQSAQYWSSQSAVKNQTNKGIGSLGRSNDNPLFSNIAAGVSLAMLFIFIFVLIRYPAVLKVNEGNGALP